MTPRVQRRQRLERRDRFRRIDVGMRLERRRTDRDDRHGEQTFL